MSEYTCDVGEMMCEVCAYLPTPVFGISGSWTWFPWIFCVFPGQLYVYNSHLHLNSFCLKLNQIKIWPSSCIITDSASYRICLLVNG